MTNKTASSIHLVGSVI